MDVAVIPAAATLIYSDFGFGEVVSAISARVRTVRGSDRLSAEKLAAVRAFLGGWSFERLLGSDLAVATDLAGRPSLALKFADAIHVAIAQRLHVPLLTCDRQQHRATQALALVAQLLQTSGV